MATFLQRMAGTLGFGEQLDEGPTFDLTEWLETTLEEELGVSKIVRDEDGDIPIEAGSSMVYVREVDPESPFLIVLAPLLEDFRMSPDVYEAINSINRQVPMAKVTVSEDEDQIVMTVALPIMNSPSSEDLMTAIQLVAEAADHFDTLLQKRFGGVTAGSDDDDSFDV